MDNFNNPFLSRLEEVQPSNPFARTTKQQQILEAADRNITKAEEASARRRSIMESNKTSFIGQLGVDEDSFGGQVLNNAAALASGASQAVGFVASLPANVGAAAEMQGITQEEMAAFAAKQQGVATPEQEALLQRSTLNQGGAVELWRQFQGLSDTVEGRIQNAQSMNKSAQGIADTFDIGGIVNRTGQSNLEDDLRAGFQDNWGKVTEGSATDKVAGVAGLLKEAVAAGVNNKDGLITFLSENIPQMALGLLGKGGKAAMLATNVGYGFDNFQKGIEEFQKENGRMPAEEELDRILGWSAAGALAEQIGDVSVLRGFGVGKGATQAASGAATKRGVGATVAGIGTGTAQGFGSEAATEAFQTFAENQAQGKETSAEDLFVAGSIGGLVGGSMRGGLETVDAVASAAPAVSEAAGKVRERATQGADAAVTTKEAVAEAVKTGDVSKLADKTSPDYSPENTVEALYAIAREAKDPVVSSTRLKEANAMVSSVREEINTLNDQIKTKTDELVALDDVDTSGFTPEQLTQHESKLDALDNELDALEAQQEALSKPLARSEKVMEQFTRLASAMTTAQKVNPTTPAEVEQVLNLSMAAPAQISDEALTALASNPQASDTQKAYASAALAYRAASKTAEQVNTNVLYGEANGLKGIQQYRKDIATAIAGGDVATAQKQLDRMNQFAARHKSKAAVAAQALAERKATGSTEQVTIAPDAQGVWSVLPTVATEAERKKKGWLNLHKGSDKVVAAAQMEAQALDAASVEMSAAIANANTAAPSAATVPSSSSNVSSSAAKPASSKPSPQNPAPTQRQSQGQKDVVQSPLSPDNKGKGEGVGSQAQAATPESSKTPTTTETKPSQTDSVSSKETKTEGGKTVPNSQELGALSEQLNEATEALRNGEEGAAERVAELQEQLDTLSNTEEEVESSTPLSVFSKAKETITNLGDQFTKLNLVSQFFTQTKSKATDASSAPLASVKDLYASLIEGKVSVKDFLADPSIDDDQQKAIQTFFKFYKANRKKIEDNLKLNRDVYGRVDMVRFMVEDGKVDENLSLAIALAAFSYVADNSGQPNYNSNEDIKAMLGLNEFDKVGRPLLNALRKAGTNERNIVASLGQKVTGSLGLKATKDAPDNLMANLQTSLGAQAWKLLDDLGILKRTELKSEFITANTPKSSEQEFDAGTKVYFGAFVRDADGNLPALAKDIAASQKGQGSILNKLFGVESSLLAPTTKPVTKIQDTTDGTSQKVPSRMKQILKHQNSVPNYLRQDTWGLLGVLGFEAMRDIAGYNRTDVNTLHKTERDSVQAKNAGLDREIDNATNFLESHDPDAPMFFEHSIWKQQRSGIRTNMFNPQTSKFHRFLVSRPEWESKVRLNNEAEVLSLKLRIGEGLGVKTDKKANTESIKEVEAKINDMAIVEAVSAIRKSLIAGEDLSAEEQASIVAGVKAGGENMHSLDALIALAYLRDAEDKGTNEITVKLMGEIDGVTNGPMLSHLLMGAATTAKDLYGMLNRGGFFSLEDADDNYNVWRGKGTNQDLYETTITNVLKNMKVSDGLKAAFYTVVGKLDDDSGKILKDGRNIIKTPLTAMVFGSSLEGAVDSMFEAFLGTVYKKMAQAHNQPDTKNATMKAINDLLVEGGTNDLFKPSHNLLETELSAKQETALRAAFDKIIGQPVIDTMNVDFAVFMNSRKTVNDAAQAAFKLYDAARKGITEKFMADKMESGEIAFRVTKGIKEPIHDLTPALKEELGGLLLPITPVQATLMSLDSNDGSAGLAVSKSDRKFSRKYAYQQATNFGTPTSTGTTGSRLAAYEYSLASPGVAMLVMSIHSTDSAISHNAVMGFGEPTQVLNVHDAHGSGLQHFERTARNLNRATFDAMLRYSPASEMNNTLQRTIAGMNELLANPEYASAIKPYLKSAVQLGTKKQPKTLGQLASEMALTAYASDKIKYETIAMMKVVDQYALEGGQYTLTEHDRKEASDRLAALQVNLSAEVEAQIAAVQTGSATRAAAKPVDQDTEYENEIQPTPAESLSRVVSPAVIAATAVNVSPAIQEQMDAGKTPVESINSQESPAQVVQEIAQAVQKTSHAFSPWGELGTSAVEHDASLVQALTDKPVMNKAEILAVLKPAITNARLPQNVREFNAQVYRLIRDVAPENVQVRYVTPETSSNDVMGKGAERSRGWYMAKGGSHQIYVLSPDHKYSAITPELLLHELTHSALAGLVENSTDPEVKELVANLDALRTKAIDYMTANGLNEFAPAVVNVHEFISWGMTNLDFQQKVLSRITGKAPRAGNSLIDGMKEFITNIVGILFRKSDKTHQAKRVNGMTLMIKNTAGLFKAAKAQKSEAEILLNMEAVDPAARVKDMTPEELFEAIQDSNPHNRPSTGFNNQLKDLLSELASKIHAPMGGVIAAAKTQSTVLSPLDAFTRTLATGKAPFAAASIATGLKVNNQEAFVMESIEATMRAALADNTANTTTAYRELVRVQQMARKQVRPMDFLPEGVTETTATQDQKNEAKQIWKSVFDHTGKDYMAKFVALALANEQVASKLGFDATREVRDSNTLYGKIMQLVDRMVNLIIGKLTKTTDAGNADEFIRQLAEDIVDIEAKRRKKVLNNKDTFMDSFESKMDDIGDAAKEKLESFSKSKFFANAKNGYIRGTGAALSIVASPERALGIMDGFNAMRKDALSKRQDMLSSLVSEMRGLAGAKDVFLKLIMATKNIERERSKTGEHLGKAVAKSFKRDNFTKEENAALTQLMHIDAGALFKQFDMAEIHNLMEDPAALQAEITKYESRLRKTPNARAMINMSRGLGYYMATGVAKTPHLLRNAHNIVRMGGIPGKLGTVPESVAVGLEADADILISLYAMKYTPVSKMTLAKDILREEINRNDGGNGVEVMLKVHRDLQAESKKSLFEGNEALAIKGYLPEVTNPYITFKIADEVEGVELIKLGYTKGSEAAMDPQDPTGTKHVYVIRDGGIARWNSGSISLTDNQRKGTSNQADNSLQANRLHSDKMAALNAINSVEIDPENIQESYMVPVMNNRGQVVNYVYTASNDFRDQMLERDNRFDHLLGTLAGNTYDKVESPMQNKAVLEALKEQYESDLAANQTQFIRVAADAEGEYADLWNMLPDQTKKDAEAIFGGKEIFLRNDMEDLIFGYRKQSLANLWGKPRVKTKKELVIAREYRPALEAMFTDMVEMLMRSYARIKGFNEDDWAKRAPMYVRNGEDIWQSIVAETKDIIVVRTGVVLMGNIMSNFTVLSGYGVPIKDMIRHHRVALKAATAYEKDSFELTQVQVQLASGVLEGKDRADLEDKARLLEDAIARNPVKELIDAGLMPTIVEDLGSADDIYSYKNQLARKVEKYTDKLNPKVKTGLEYAYIGQKTPLYQGLNRATQLSDFVARYTLFHHLQERKNKPLSRSEAITRASDAFVNYDIPTHRSMQYMNDMGFLMFTKYYLRIQRVILQLFAEKPARMMLMGLMGGFLNGVETILDSNMLGRIGNNPFDVGALKYPTVIDDLLTVNAAVSLK